ncbi:hypothetical protein Pla108_07180 [Botrimarina colliarenosi]|uniref:Uncharacterized protein n=1 Tax=Botrimarina colliarenosi TaxID=2528001 RepID=A0A5C6AKS4_9BACT|nr:DUF6263 family protein [Botrimarina colliarenosi]TWT99775.1 hypothetical protein Pla108_07180 [Botrimarina colliarenosi]
MNSHCSASLRLCAILIAVTPAIGAEPLVWKWAPGDSDRYQVVQTMRMTVDAGPAGEVTSSMRQDMVMRWTVEDVDADGVARISQGAERIVMKNRGPMGQDFTYDSDSDEPPAGMAALVAPMYDAMVEHPFVVTMRPSGEITEVVLSDDLSKAFDRLPGNVVSGDFVAQMTKEAVVSFPTEPLAVGDQWTATTPLELPPLGEMKVVTTYVYEGTRDVEGRTYEAIKPSVQIEIPPGQANVRLETKDADGEILFDREQGRVFRSRFVQSMVVRVTTDQGEIANGIKQAIELRQLGEGESLSLDDNDDSTPSDE